MGQTTEANSGKKVVRDVLEYVHIENPCLIPPPSTVLFFFFFHIVVLRNRRLMLKCLLLSPLLASVFLLVMKGWVLDEQKVVTFRWLALVLSVTANAAKK